MNKKSVIIVLLLLGFTRLMAQKATLYGTLSGFDEGVRIIVSEAVGSKTEVRDTVDVNAKGHYEISLQVSQPSLFILTFTQPNCPSMHAMVLPKDKQMMDFQYLDDYNFVLVTATKGSRNAEVYRLFNAALYATLPVMKRLDNEYSLPSTSDDRRQELAMQFQQLQVEQKAAVRKVVEEHPDVLMSAFVVTYFENEFATYAPLYEQVRDALKPNYADNLFVRHLDEKITKSLGPGSMAPEIAMKDKDGNERKLSDLRGNVVLIDFWASWCSPCRAENPNVVRLYHKYHSKGFEVYSVSMDKTRDAWLNAIQADGLIWPNHVSDLRGWTSSGGAAYGVSSIPHTVLVDRQGRIIAKNLRGRDLENKLKEIFGE